jgi:hypothetical protein
VPPPGRTRIPGPAREIDDGLRLDGVVAELEHPEPERSRTGETVEQRRAAGCAEGLEERLHRADPDTLPGEAPAGGAGRVHIDDLSTRPLSTIDGEANRHPSIVGQQIALDLGEHDQPSVGLGRELPRPLVETPLEVERAVESVVDGALVAWREGSDYEL